MPKLTLKQKIILIFIFYALAVIIIGSISYFDLDKINNKLFLLEKSEDFTNNVLQARRYEKNYLYEFWEPANTYIKIFSSFLNDIVKNILPFKKILKEGMEFISLIFYIIFSTLIWQTIVALKRLTKR